jgi:hypothetical protein
MGNTVFANGRNISCKSGDGQVSSAFPDVCLSPPSPPAGPIPVPYPLFSFSRDTTDGSKSVVIDGKEAMLRDKSYFKKCTGDEAATKSLGQGVVTHTLTGKVYFAAWSMDVLIEGENVVRHLDPTTSNHASPLGNESVPMVEMESMTVPPPVDCAQVLAKFPVEPYDEQKKKTGEGGTGVYANAQSHHIIQNSHFQYPRTKTLKEICPGYEEGDAPCIPLDDKSDVTTAHGLVSQMQKADATAYRATLKETGASPTYTQARADAKKQLMAPKPGPALKDEEAECILVKVDEYFKKACGGKTGDGLKVRAPGQRGPGIPSSGTPSIDLEL